MANRAKNNLEQDFARVQFEESLLRTRYIPKRLLKKRGYVERLILEERLVVMLTKRKAPGGPEIKKERICSARTLFKAKMGEQLEVKGFSLHPLCNLKERYDVDLKEYEETWVLIDQPPFNARVTTYK